MAESRCGLAKNEDRHATIAKTSRVPPAGPFPRCLRMSIDPDATTPMPGRTLPPLAFWQFWTMCLEFLGLRFGFALQNANVSRIFQTLVAGSNRCRSCGRSVVHGSARAADVDYFSDRTWTRLGHRRSYSLVGRPVGVCDPGAHAALTEPMGRGGVTGSINASMEPFRAFVGDQLPAA
jgi:maltose/moltooligosaccharide transporter